MKFFSSFFIITFNLFLYSCSSTELTVEPIKSNINSIKNDITSKSFSEQQKQQVKLHKFYFDYYSNGESFYSIDDKKNEHLKMLVKAEKRIDNPKLLLDLDHNDELSFDEITKFVTDKIYLDDFRSYIVNFSFSKLDKNSDKIISNSEFLFFNKEIKDKDVKDFNLNVELVSFDYNSDNSLSISEYEDFFIKYLIKKITWNK